MGDDFSVVVKAEEGRRKFMRLGEGHGGPGVAGITMWYNGRFLADLTADLMTPVLVHQRVIHAP